MGKGVTASKQVIQVSSKSPRGCFIATVQRVGMKTSWISQQNQIKWGPSCYNGFTTLNPSKPGTCSRQECAQLKIHLTLLSSWLLQCALCKMESLNTQTHAFKCFSLTNTHSQDQSEPGLNVGESPEVIFSTRAEHWNIYNKNKQDSLSMCRIHPPYSWEMRKLLPGSITFQWGSSLHRSTFRNGVLIHPYIYHWHMYTHAHTQCSL